jgi:hypothetical protein
MNDYQINTRIGEITGDDPHWKCAKDYCNDLNAMHEAEKLLFPKHEIAWHEQLTYVCGGSWIIMLTATARQRAEAFLKTLKKWEESK